MSCPASSLKHDKTFCRLGADSHDRPLSVQVIKDLKGSDYSWSYQTPPSSPSSSSSRKSSMCRWVGSSWRVKGEVNPGGARETPESWVGSCFSTSELTQHPSTQGLFTCRGASVDWQERRPEASLMEHHCVPGAAAFSPVSPDIIVSHLSCDLVIGLCQA